MACGAVVVASNVGGLALSVQDGKTGYLVPARDAGAFAGRIARVLSDPILAQQLRAAAAREGQRYSWQRTADRLFQIYDHAGATASCQRGCPTGEREYATVCDYCS
jgi:D-inositol-3-phosphate glycosyltransferase